MPYKSKAQHKKFRAMEARGDLPKGTSDRWMKETPNYDQLPETTVEAKPKRFSKRVRGLLYRLAERDVRKSSKRKKKSRSSHKRR